MTNNNGFTCQEQYEDVYNAIAKAAVVDFTEVETLDVKYFGYDYIAVQIDGLYFDIDLAKETIYNIVCDYPMTMYEIEILNSVQNNISAIYEAGRKRSLWRI